MGSSFSATFEKVDDFPLFVDPAYERRWAVKDRDVRIQGIVDTLAKYGSRMPDDRLQVSILHLALLDKGTRVDLDEFIDLASFKEPARTIEMLESGQLVLQSHLGVQNG